MYLLIFKDNAAISNGVKSKGFSGNYNYVVIYSIIKL